jgi:hypothetical protein
VEVLELGEGTTEATGTVTMRASTVGLQLGTVAVDLCRHNCVNSCHC